MDNPKVREEVKNILRFWLDKGVKGFRCDVINVLYKDNLANGKKKMILTGSEHYLSLPGTHEILHKIHRIMEEYDAFTVGETVFVDDLVKNRESAAARGIHPVLSCLHGAAPDSRWPHISTPAELPAVLKAMKQ